MHLPLTRRRLLHGMGLAPLASLGLVATATAAAPDTWHMPDEGDAHRATWMSFGPSERVWGRRLLKPAREHLAQIARTIAAFEPVHLLVREQEHDLAARLCGNRVTLEVQPVDDLWMRDTGPVFVRNGAGEWAGVDFNFNGWGNKQSHARDAEVAEYVTDAAEVQRLRTRLVLEGGGIEVDVLDLSRLTSDYGRHIHPCKGCVSTAMPLCHWPCSCYPNHALRQTGDWMNEIYERWVAAHGVIVLTPTHWYQAASPLKLMIDRLVCADGGNPDPTSTHGKKPDEAKALELEGWGYPKHLEGRVYGVVVHGDVAGPEGLRRNLTDWLDWMGLVDAGAQARLDRYIGYYAPYATSHEALDADADVQEEVRNVARAVVLAVAALRAGKLQTHDRGLKTPRPK